MKLKGTLAVIMPTQQVSDKFAKRDFVIKTPDEKYPQSIQIQVTQDKCSLLDNFVIGDEVEAHINIRGREWVNKAKGITQYFNTIEAWKLDKLSGAKVATDYKGGASVGGDEGLPF